MYAESVYLVIFFIIPVPYISKLFWAEPVKKSPCRRKSFGSGLIITNVPLRETYEGHVLYIVSEILGTEEQLICFEVFFLSDRVRSLAMLVGDSLTDSLTNCCLVSLIDVTLACEDACSKLVEVVTVADVDDENRIGNSLL